jgi:hypothetical protein
VTKTDVRRLLKDFEIEWWFAALNEIKDIGSPELIAKLLILQRQGDFVKKETPSTIINPAFVGGGLVFDFLTPVTTEVNRKTTAKSLYQAGALYTAWGSTLEDNWEAESPRLLTAVRDSFVLL